MNAQQIDKMLDAKANRRMAAESKYFDRIDAREEQAEQMIGELANGKLYVSPVGGKYREGTRSELVSFLIRNNYA